MKTFSSCALAIASILCCAVVTAESSEKAKETPKPDPAPAASAVRAVPIQDYWNANSWDPIGGSLFWHATKDKSNPRGTSGRNARHREERSNASQRRTTRP